MTIPLPALRDFSDRLSPMVVKEMRQGLRTRFFTAALIVFHVLLGCLMLSHLWGFNEDDMHQTFWIVILLSLLGVLPAQAFNALNEESKDGTLEMLRMTGITAFRIVWGKWVTCFTQTLLIASSLLPYLIARYFVGGAEIAPELLGLAAAVIASAMVTAGVVAFSSQSSLWIRLISNGVLAFFTFYLGAMVYYFLLGPGSQQFLTSLLSLSLWEKMACFLLMPLVAVTTVYLLLSLGASRVASVAEDHGSTKRVVMLALMTLFCVTGLFLTSNYGISGGMWCFVPMLVLTMIFGMDITTEAMPLYPCVIQEVAARYPRLKFMHSLLYPGWVSGLFCHSILTVLVVLLCSIMFARSTSSDAVVCIIFGSCLVGVMVPACIHTQQENRFAHWCVVQAILIVASILIGIAGAVSGGALGVLGIFTPITALVGSGLMGRDGVSSFGMAAVVSVFWFFGAVARALTEYTAYHRLEADVEWLKAHPEDSTSTTPEPHASA
jgi:hypothetical protein